MKKLPGKGLMALESEFDFFSRFFCPKLGIDEVNTLPLIMSQNYVLRKEKFSK